MTPRNFDVCIIGAGPAGLSAAETLLCRGASVCIVEKHERPGGKACGGGLTRAAMGRIPGIHGAPCRRLAVHSGPWRTVIDTDEPYMTLASRVDWQNNWLASLRERGVAVFNRTRFRVLTTTGVLTDRGALTCTFVIGADGAVSRVRRALHLPSAVGVIAMQLRQTERPDLSLPAAVWFHPCRFGAGYAWRFPHSECCRFGVGVPICTHSPAMLKSAFRLFLGAQHCDADSGVVESGSIGCHYAGHRFGRVFLAGDAAGLASPVTGEGIAQALESGAEVAREIIDPHYRSQFIAGLSTQHRRTFSALSGGFPGPRILAATALLLKIPALKQAALSRFS